MLAGAHGPTEPVFRIGRIPVFGDLILAPMAGYSDLPFRSLCRRFGSSISYTEFVSAKEILHGRTIHARKALAFLPWERPVIIQIFDGDETRLVEAAGRIEQLQPDAIDINMGCSVHKVASRGAGAALLRDPEKVGRIFRRLTKSLSVPVTGKIRLGWDAKSRNFREVLDAMQDNGAAAVAVHARTSDQGYAGEADWEAISSIVQVARIPVIGNGDVRSVTDIDRMKAVTGCAAVMVGRGAMGNPWIFARRERSLVGVEERVKIAKYHYQLMEDFYGEPQATIFIRKHLAKYFSEIHGVRQFRPYLVCVQSKHELYHLLDAMERGGAPPEDSHFCSGPDGSPLAYNAPNTARVRSNEA